MAIHDNTNLSEHSTAVSSPDKINAASNLTAPRQFGALDGFRFVAICTIIVHHANGLLGFQAPTNIARMGILVNYFFVLSGFVLAHQYPRLENAPQYLRYLGSRVARVVPVCLFTLFLICFLSPLPVFDKAKLLPAFFAHLFLVQSWFADPNYYLCFNAPSWTLSVDLFLYLLLPIALVMAKRVWWLFFASLAVSFLAADCATKIASHDPIWSNFFFPPIRIFDFAMGVLAYQFALKQGFKIPLVAAVCLEIYLVCSAAVLLGSEVFVSNSQISSATTQISNLNSNVSRIFYHTIPTIDFAVLICVLTCGNGLLTKIFSYKPFVLLGTFSCSLYLLHFPIIVYLRILSADYKPAFSPVLAGTIALFLLVASLSLFLIFEDPARKFLNKQFDHYFALWFPGKTAKRAYTSKRSTTALVATSLLSTAVLWLSIDGTIKAERAKAPNPAAVSASELGASGSFANSLSAPQNICFGNTYTLHKIQFVAKANQIVLRTLWHATEQATNSSLAVHLLNEKGEIVRQYDHMLLQKAPEEPLLWSDSVAIEKTAFNNIKTVALAVVVNKAAIPFANNDKAASDWGNHRLLIKWPIAQVGATSSSNVPVVDIHQEK